jgi:predicted nucleotide-binding protein
MTGENNHDTTDSPVSAIKLETFLQRIPDASKVTGNHLELIRYFGFFLTEILGHAQITNSSLRACFDAASIKAPANVSDTIKRSKAFVMTADGRRLDRDVKARIQTSLAHEPQAVSSQPSAQAGAEEGRTRDVVVIHGRDERVRESVFQLLRSVGLNPIEWNEAVHRTGHGSPYTGEVLDALFGRAQAIVAVFSPDERVELRKDLRNSRSGENESWQSRPNVFVETGMALAKDASHTILIQVGDVRPASDLFGRHILKMDDSPEMRNSFVQRLTTAGCAVKLVGNDWLKAGKFRIPQSAFRVDRGKQK